MDDVIWKKVAHSLVNESTAAHLSTVRAPPEIIARATDLASRHGEGQLTESELEEYEELVLLNNLLSQVALEAKLFLSNAS